MAARATPGLLAQPAAWPGPLAHGPARSRVVAARASTAIVAAGHRPSESATGHDVLRGSNLEPVAR